VTDIFKEIEEDLRAERLQNFWKRYSLVVAIAAIAIVAGSGGYLQWRKHELELRAAEGDKFSNALTMADKGQTDAALAALSGIEATAGSGYATLARLDAASLEAGNGKIDDALRSYDAIAADTKLETVFRDLATLSAGYLRVDREAPETFKPRLQSLTEPGNPWHYSAQELLALADLKAGHTADAKAGFTKLADDATAPQNIRARAAEILAALGSS
jgi:hypothetical protein